MRNLKKFLALALAVMMTLSLMVTANAITTDAAVTDRDSITDEFKEAVAVLNGLGIITGYEDGTFRPDKPISRQETTALVYRLHSGDVKDTKNDLYSTADNIKQFTDVKADGGQKWSAGYIGYCANQGIIKGVSDTRFAPTHEVTGYQVLAMVLRAIGYGQNKEYEGSGWQTRVASSATNLGLLKNVTNTNYSATLSAPATRELVAEIVFQAALQGTVTYTPAFGYQEYGDASLGVQKFQLNCGNYTVIDKWGRPGYQWFKGSSPIATIKALPVKTYDTTVRECDVAHDLSIAEDAIYNLYVNSNAVTTNSYRIEATDTVTRVGGQGRITEFYGDLTHPHKNNTWSKSVVMIDTYLAKVTKVTEVVKDPAGHIIKKAELHLDVYDDGGTRTYNSADSTRGNESGDPSKHIATRDTNWTYSVGDFVLVQGYTDKTHDYDNTGDKLYGASAGNPASPATNTSGLNHVLDTNAQAAIEKTAFETNLLAKDDSKNNLTIVGVPTMELAKQTTTYWNAGKHQVNGEDKNDQMTLYMDYAGTKTGTTFAWYYDAKGNLIGIGPVPDTVNYGVITSLWSSFNQGETNTDGTAKTYAKVLYANGEEATIVIDKFFTNGTQAGGHDRAANAQPGAVMDDTTSTNTTELIPQYDYNSGVNTMKAEAIPNYVTGKDARSGGYLMVAPVASINTANEDPYNNGANTSPSVTAGDADKFGIIKGNLYKFVASADGEMTAIDVAGQGNANSNRYKGHYNYGASANGANASKLYKNYSYITVNNSAASGAITWLDSDTRIMVSDGNVDLAKRTIKTYTLSELPGDIAIADETEIDWADVDNDGRADYVFVTGKIEGTTTYGLFYYNGGAANWNDANGTGTLTGWLNGDATTITFDDYDEFKLVRESQDYNAHIFALQLVNGVVSDVMEGHSDKYSGFHPWLLYKADNGVISTEKNASTAAISADISNATNIKGTGGTTTFGLGDVSSKWGNPYTQKTQIIYFNDQGSANNMEGSIVTYDADRRVVTAHGVDYYLTPNTKIIGLGMGVTQGTAVLEYLDKSDKNDVTIVFEDANIKSIVEIYVATDPNVTPGSTTEFKPTGAGVTTVGTTTALDALILSGTRDQVIFSSVKASADKAPNSDAEDLLYFPFYADATGTASIVIRNKATGAPVYTETGNVSAGANYCVVNFADGNIIAGAWRGTFTAGTYSYTVTLNGKTVSSGDFTLSAK